VRKNKHCTAKPQVTTIITSQPHLVRSVWHRRPLRDAQTHPYAGDQGAHVGQEGVLALAPFLPPPQGDHVDPLVHHVEEQAEQGAVRELVEDLRARARGMAWEKPNRRRGRKKIER